MVWWLVIHFTLTWFVCASQKYDKCLDLTNHCDGPDSTCASKRYQTYAWCRNQIEKIQKAIPGPNCPTENLTTKNWAGCERAAGFKGYTMMIELKYFDFVCCDNENCTKCDDNLVDALCEGKPRSHCDLNFILKDTTYGVEQTWKSPSQTNSWGGFRSLKKTFFTVVFDEKAKLRFRVIDRDFLSRDGDDTIVEGWMYLQPVYPCKPPKKEAFSLYIKEREFINGEWFKHRDRKSLCVTMFHTITKATKKYQFEEGKYKKKAFKVDMLLRTLWIQEIVRDTLYEPENP